MYMDMYAVCVHAYAYACRPSLVDEAEEAMVAAAKLGVVVVVVVVVVVGVVNGRGCEPSTGCGSPASPPSSTFEPLTIALGFPSALGVASCNDRTTPARAAASQS